MSLPASRDSQTVQYNMFLLFVRCLSVQAIIRSAVASVVGNFPGPKVTLDYGSFIGTGRLVEGLEQFYGIPYAEPPVGKLRFANPIKPTKEYWEHDCTILPPACPQQTLGGNTSTSPYGTWPDELLSSPLHYFRPLGPGQEDCLTLDIARPVGVTTASRLPVMYWIFPGGFNLGTSWELAPDSLVQKSVSIGLPIIHVAVNHRLNVRIIHQLKR